MTRNNLVNKICVSRSFEDIHKSQRPLLRFSETNDSENESEKLKKNEVKTLLIKFTVHKNIKKEDLSIHKVHNEAAGNITTV